MPASVFDFRAINQGLKKLGGEEWYTPTQHIPAPAAEPATGLQKTAEQIAADLEAAYDPFGGWLGGY
jgi:hypothetical protein